MSQRVKGRGSRYWVIVLAAGALIALIACISCYVVYRFALPDIRGENRVTLEVAYSPEKQALFEELVKRFNAGRPRTPSGKHITVVASQLEPDQWHAAIGDDTVADSVCDRLVHGAHRLKLGGESIRKVLAESSEPNSQPHRQEKKNNNGSRKKKLTKRNRSAK